MSQSILIVEDDSFLRSLLVKKLSSSGFSVLESADGNKALKSAKADKPSLILLDLLLPTIDGFEVLEKLKQDPDTAKISVIVLSNLGQKEDIDKCLNLGATDYLIKSQLTPEEIIVRVKEVMERLV